MLRALDIRLRRLPSNSDDDLVRLEPVLLPVLLLNLELVLVDEAGVAGVVVDAVLVEVLLVDAVEPVNVGVSLLLKRGPVKGDRLVGWGRVEAGHAEAVGVGVSEVLGDVGGVPHDLSSVRTSWVSQGVDRSWIGKAAHLLGDTSDVDASSDVNQWRSSRQLDLQSIEVEMILHTLQVEEKPR
jgi:hypothetical protein